MSAHAHATLDPPERRQLGAIGPRVFKIAGGVGVVGLGVGLLLSLPADEGLRRFMFSYLAALVYFASLSLGALFFVLLQHLTRAGWSVTVRRVAECFAANFPVLALLTVPVLIAMPVLYEWANADAVAADPGIRKGGWLHPVFLVVRVVFYFAVWGWLGWHFLAKSRAQDVSGDVGITRWLEKLSAPGMILFGLTLTFFSFDLMMSLDPHWYSTMYGVYYFSGATVGFFALLAVTLLWLQGRGQLVDSVTAEHYHDVGKLLFAFVFFWGYIAFSQYMLIWYAQLPELTPWYIRRGTSTDAVHFNAWSCVSLVLLFGHFLIPFVALLGRMIKRSRRGLMFWALWMLVMHAINMVWMIRPEMRVDSITPVPMVALEVLATVACFVGIGGLWLAGAAKVASRGTLVPERDPRLEESLAFDNVKV